MRNIRRFFQTAVYAGAALFLGLSLSGCRKSEDGYQAEHSEELTWFSDLSWWSPGNWDADPKSGTGEITEKTGVEIRYLIPEDNGDTRLSLMMINGNMPDILSVSDEQMIRHLITSDAVWNLDELLQQYLPDSHLLVDYPKDLKTLLMERDGGWYGLSGDIHSQENQEEYGEASEFYQTFQRKKQSSGIIWNKVLLKRLGYEIEDLQTEEAVLKIFKEVQEREITVNKEVVTPVLVDGENYSRTTLAFLEDTFGASCVSADGAYQERISTKEGCHALEFLNKLFRLGYAEHQQTILTAYNIKRRLNSGQVLCFIGDVEHSGINPEEWISSGAIHSASGEEPVFGEKEEFSLGEMTTFVSKNCKAPEAAARFLTVLTTQEGMKSYLKSGESWWPLRNDDWYYCQLSDEDEKMNAWKQLICAYKEASGPKTYDRELIDAAGDTTKICDIQATVRESFSRGVNSVLWAENDEEFDSAYEELLTELQEAGLFELEADRTEKMKQK